MSAIKISISLNEQTLKGLDIERGLVTRSAFIDYILGKSLKKKVGKVSSTKPSTQDHLLRGRNPHG